MKSIFLLFSFFCVLGLSAQDDQTSTAKGASKHNEIGVLLGHTQLRNGKSGANKGVLNVASWVVFYNYQINEKWRIGLHTDFVTEDFVASSVGDEGYTIKRSHPVAPAVMALYKPGEHFSFLLGAGADIDKDETLRLIRLGLEYSLEIQNGWEFLTSFTVDYRIKSYQSLQLAVGLSKYF